MTQYQQLLPRVIEIAKKTGRAIMPLYEQNDFVVTYKSDDSPLTEADILANGIISEGLSKLTPLFPILSEEGLEIAFAERQAWQNYWLVDPVDGTNEFISHTGQFTVNIALISGHHSVLGVSYAPALQTCYYACKDYGAYRENAAGEVSELKTRPVNLNSVKVVVSKKIGSKGMEKFLSALPHYELIEYGGSLKICLVAEGGVDIYPRLGFNFEWDTAAGQCILEEAGGALLDLNLQPLRYNLKDSLCNPYFVVLGDANFNWKQYLSLLKHSETR